MHKSIQILRDEHRSISAVLQGLLALARSAQNAAVRPEFPVFHAMIHYIDSFPERMHHPKEDKYLFERLQRRDASAQPLLDELRAEHVRGATLIRDLERALLDFEVHGASRAAEFLAKANAYAEFHWEHMRKEEQKLLPLAERMLSEEDWRAIDEAFAGNKDPIADLREQDFERLYQRILALAPEPVGLGAAWKRAG